jgi:hypothetical protein
MAYKTNCCCCFLALLLLLLLLVDGGVGPLVPSPPVADIALIFSLQNPTAAE